jgi:ankyrin repeat protein
MRDKRFLILLFLIVLIFTCGSREAALIDASKKGDKEKVELLLKKGANVNAKDKDSLTALMWASFNGHKEIVKLLKSYGAKE